MSELLWDVEYDDVTASISVFEKRLFWTKKIQYIWKVIYHDTGQVKTGVSDTFDHALEAVTELRLQALRF